LKNQDNCDWKNADRQIDGISGVPASQTGTSKVVGMAGTSSIILD